MLEAVANATAPDGASSALSSLVETGVNCVPPLSNKCLVHIYS